MSLVTSSSYAEAKKALNAAAPDRVISRGRESDEIRSHLLACFKEKNGVSIYVNGQPGTGKTLCVDHILLGLKVVVVLNNFYKYRNLEINSSICSLFFNFFKERRLQIQTV
jgi:Cdc6-like AAA superfamily ATPase